MINRVSVMITVLALLFGSEWHTYRKLRSLQTG